MARFSKKVSVGRTVVNGNGVGEGRGDVLGHFTVTMDTYIGSRKEIGYVPLSLTWSIEGCALEQ